jgi:hypothetical protein
MKAHGFADELIERILWKNPIAFFAQSGRLTGVETAPPVAAATYEGNSLLRGGRTKI